MGFEGFIKLLIETSKSVNNIIKCRRSIRLIMRCKIVEELENSG
jgi:hypothetical protein